MATVSAIVLLALLPADAAEPLATITVEAGAHERLDTPVCVAVPKGAEAWPPVNLREAGTGEAATLIACQVEAGDPPRLAFILPGKTPAGAARVFEVTPLDARLLASRAEVRKRDGGLDVIVHDKPVLRYHAANTELPEGVEEKFAHEAYIHPAWTPAGRVVTDDYPPDHKHQRGIWFSWTKTEFEGRHPDFWNLGDQTATIRFTEMGPTADGPVFASFAPHHEHLDTKAPGGPKVILKEQWAVRVWNAGGPDAGYFLWDLTSRQQCVADSPLRLPKYHYGGLGYRGNRAWLTEVAMKTSEGKGRKDGNESTARWLDLAGPLDGGQAGCLILIHPSNFRYPQPLRLNPKQPQICVAPSQGGDWEIKPGEEYVSHYRFVIHDGPMDDATAERLWRDFAEPPTVKIAANASVNPSAGAAASTSSAGPSDAAGATDAAKDKPLKICMLAGSDEYSGYESLSAFKKHLESAGRAVCTLVRGKDKAASLPGVEALTGCDVLLVFLRRNTLLPDQLRVVQDWCKAGKPVVGVRTASHAFQNWLEFDKEVLGGNYQGHYGHGPVAKVNLLEVSKDHPVLKGVQPFESAYSLYKNTGLADDVTLLATATADGHTEPVAWTRLHNGGRVFYTSLGGPKDFENPNFRRMLTNAIFWTAKREAE